MIRINLLAAERPAQKKAGGGLPSIPSAPGAVQGYLLLGLFAGGALVACGLAWFWESSKIAELDRQIAAANKRKAELQVIAKQVQQLEARRNSVKERKDFIEKLKRDRGAPVHLLDEISKALPDFVWLTSLKQTGTSLIISGQSSTLPAVADFMGNLRQAGENCRKPNPDDKSQCWFPEVNLRDSTARDNVVTFNLTATFRPPLPPQAQAGQTAAPAAAAQGGK